MDELNKIRNVSIKYGISARTLRYYEDIGLICSKRSCDYAYRMYDETAIKRLEQILILRKLNISVKDIQRIFNTNGSDIVLEILNKKIRCIDDEIISLHELKLTVLEFISEIEQMDFKNSSKIELLYKKAKKIETQLINKNYIGKPANKNRLLVETEKLDEKTLDIIIVRLPKFRAMTTGLVEWDEVFITGINNGVKYEKLTVPILFDGRDFLYGNDKKAAWIWRVRDDVTEADTYPFEIIEFIGGLYAVSVSIDDDGKNKDKVKNRMAKWLKSTSFIIDQERELMGHMIYVDEEIINGLGYEQMAIYEPVKLR